MSNSPYQDKPSLWSSHSRIAARLESLPAGSSILDVGAASGMLARRLENKPLRFFGIEANPESAAIASTFYEKFWICTFEEAPEEVLRAYEVIVLADVLEHMPDPESALTRLAGFQLPGNLFIISVPNVANLWVRLQLLAGHFDYTERGILDRTHLRFFTRESLIDLVKGAGLEIYSIQATPIPLELVSPFFLKFPGRQLHAALAWLTSLMPSLLGYQFIVEAKKNVPTK